MKDCCKHKKKDKKCRRKSDKKTFKLPRRFSKNKCKNPKGFTMRSSCAPYKDCSKTKKRMKGGKRNKVIYFSLGCFWGIEEKFSKMEGVIATRVGYMGGHTSNPTYKKVLKGDTGHAETVKIVYDPDIVRLKDLLIEFKKIHEKKNQWKASLLKEFKKVHQHTKDQYRPAIFYETPGDNILIQELKLKDVEVKMNSKFFPAEEYHQKYNEKQRGGEKEFLYNPDDPKKSFDVYIDKNPKDTIPIKYTTLKDVKDTINKLEKLYKNNKYPHKRIWQVAMIMKVRLEVLKKKKPKQYKLSKKYYNFLKQRTKIKDNKERKNLNFKFDKK